MVTLRTFNTPAEAALAKSLLDDHDIVCGLADENAWLYGGAPLAMPVRLLVAEDQIEEAARILKDPPDGRNAVLSPGEKAAALYAGGGLEKESGDRRNNPWEFLALSVLVAIPGILLLVQKHELLIVAPLRRHWFRSVIPVTSVRILGALVVLAAMLLAWLFFYVRREIKRDHVNGNAE